MENNGDSDRYYQDDFESFEDSYYESVARESRKQSSVGDYHQQGNLSTQLPSLHRKESRYGANRKDREVISKSTMELKRENR